MSTTDPCFFNLSCLPSNARISRPAPLPLDPRAVRQAPSPCQRPLSARRVRFLEEARSLNQTPESKDDGESNVLSATTSADPIPSSLHKVSRAIPIPFSLSTPVVAQAPLRDPLSSMPPQLPVRALTTKDLPTYTPLILSDRENPSELPTATESPASSVADPSMHSWPSLSNQPSTPTTDPFSLSIGFGSSSSLSSSFRADSSPATALLPGTRPPQTGIIPHPISKCPE